MREALKAIESLEVKKPKYIMYTTDTWRMDDIPESIQVPEVAEYINRKYTFKKQIGGTKILKRVE